MQQTWRRHRVLGIPSPLQHRIYLNQLRMLPPHLMMSLHKRRMIDDMTLFLFQLFRYSFYIPVFVEWKSFRFCFPSCLVLLLCIFSMVNEVLLLFSCYSSHACFLFVLIRVKFSFSCVFGPFAVVHFLLNGKVLTFASFFIILLMV